MLIPHPLHRRVIEPTLLEWTKAEPQCAEPHRWLGDMEHLGQAIELDPDDQLARKKLIVAILNFVGYSTHELPDYGYRGSPSEGLAALNEAEAFLQALRNDEERQKLAAWLEEQRDLINGYLRKG